MNILTSTSQKINAITLPAYGVLGCIATKNRQTVDSIILTTLATSMVRTAFSCQDFQSICNVDTTRKFLVPLDAISRPLNAGILTLHAHDAIVFRYIVSIFGVVLLEKMLLLLSLDRI